MLREDSSIPHGYHAAIMLQFFPFVRLDVDLSNGFKVPGLTFTIVIPPFVNPSTCV